jgi:glycosyltransferase involved in cell wall biosynthesis
VRRINMGRWRRALPESNLREVDLRDQVLVSLGRPKMMADYLVAMESLGVRIRFYPLLHDMIPLHEYTHSRQNMFARNFAHDNQIVIRHAEKLLTNSAFTKTEVEHFAALGHFPTIPPVVPVLLPHELRPTNEAVNLDLPDVPYLFGVGLTIGRKNIECVLQAMMKLHDAGRPVPMLLLAGAPRKRIVAYLGKSEFTPIKDKVRFILNPNQAELRILYQKALALVIPSHMEGFGLPLGEALWLGTPGLSSNAAALREVGRDLAEYFDPNDPGALAALIDQLHTDPKARAALRDKIARHHASLRTWKDVSVDIIAAVSPASTAV